jgi:glycosyltransferase involved in cell wall biosynthesis
MNPAIVERPPASSTPASPAVGIGARARRGEHAEGPLKFAVLYPGARMHYAVPAILQRAGMLQAFYTDAVGNLGMLDVMRRLTPSFVRTKPVRRLLGRSLPVEIPKEVVVSTPFRAITDAALSRLSPRSRDLVPVQSSVSWMQRRIVADGFRGANALYCMDNGDLEVISEAKRRGLFIVYEQICHPEIGRILREERARCPGLEPQDSEALVEEGIRRDLAVWDLVDVVLAPSNFVRDGMISLGCHPDRIAVVPYGLHEDWFDIPAQPKPGRVLFVGSVRLLKGNHYLAATQRILRDRGVDAEFRVIGPVPHSVLESPLFQGPHYVGQVPRQLVRAEFAQADLFAFPTLSEGFGLAHLEALACGVPVVTTPHCGSVVRDGVDGYIVPIRDPAAMADRLERLLGDRKLRSHMSANARARARQYSWTHYSDVLLKAFLRASSSGVRAAG